MEDDPALTKACHELKVTADIPFISDLVIRASKIRAPSTQYQSLA